MSRYPTLYQINIRVLLTRLSRELGRLATLDDINDQELQRLTPQESVNTDLQSFYTKLLNTLRTSVFCDGTWRLLTCHATWEGDYTWDSFISFLWEGENKNKWLVVVNYSPFASRCFVEIPFNSLDAASVRFEDLMSNAIYDRDLSDLMSRGLYLDLAPWGFHVFKLISCRTMNR